MTARRCMAFFLFTAIVHAQSARTFELVANYSGAGFLATTLVGPGPTSGSERFYASVLYSKGTLDVLSIDPSTGITQVFQSPLPLEEGAWGMTFGPDGNVYLGTCSHAHFFKLDPRQGALTDLGRPSPTEAYIWSVAFGSDNRLYGVTYPNSKLVRYDPVTGELADLARLDPTQQYARSIVASADGFIYAGIGTSKANIATYEIRTGQHREILPPDAQSIASAKVYRGQDGRIYGAVGNRTFRLNQWTATEVESSGAVAAPSPNTTRDGHFVSFVDSFALHTLLVTDLHTQRTAERTIEYRGKPVSLFRIGVGPDGALYGGTVQPIHFVRADMDRHRFEEIGSLGGGEVYSILRHQDLLLMAAYYGLSPLMSYRPQFPFSKTASDVNPEPVGFPGSDTSWRPMAMINGPDGKVYVGAVAAYGQLSSPLIEWDAKSGSIQRNTDVVQDQGVVSLASWHDLIVGGTTINGGPGSQPTQKDAKLFVWNPKTHRKEFELAPVPGAAYITDLIAAPNDLVYGIADNTLFAFNPVTRKIDGRTTVPFSNPMQGSNQIYDSVFVDASGNIWGLAQEGIFMIDTKSFKITLAAQSPVKITGGFAVDEKAIYFISGSAVYRYNR